MLKTLAEAYPIRQGKGAGINVCFERNQQAGLCEVVVDGKSATVRYATPAQAGRALGSLLSNLASRRRGYRESTSFTTLGIMLDCSRNAVMTVDHLKTWLQRLALLGYNMVMLYTEDTYELPGEPWFGYKRGAYTAKEIKTIDAYAAKLNIEVVPCIQTLGHLEKILRHPAYLRIKDTSSVLLVQQKRTYKLIEKMIRHWRSVCRTDRIHIGMDEAHDLGRGRYLDRHGYRSGFDLFSEHLIKVAKICKKYGRKPMIWSDMYFRLGCPSGEYYDSTTVIPKAAVRKIPKAVELVYWDYYHDKKSFYLDWIKRHRKMGKEPIMGSGIWTWCRYWYDHRTTQRNTSACIEACLETGVKEIFFTQWGDNGAYCDHDSAFAGMVFCADKIYGNNRPSPDRLEKRFAAVCGGSYAAHILASDIHGGVKEMEPEMWDDPMFETHVRTRAGDDPKRIRAAAAGFAKLAGKLKRHRHDRSTGDLNHAFLVANAFGCRYAFCADLLTAYRRKDERALRAVQKRIPETVKSIRAMEVSFRNMWLRHQKPQGLLTIQGHFGMLEVRYRELTRRLDEYLKGIVDEIPELDCPCPPR